MPLRLSASLHKALLSTPADIVGEYETDRILVTHAWPDFNRQDSWHRLTEGPSFRRALMLVFQTDLDEVERDSHHDFWPTGRMFSSYLSVLYGKRFEFHGLVESSGLFRVPDLAAFSRTCDPSIPHNSHSVRVDFPIPFDLAKLQRIDRLLEKQTLAPEFVQSFQGAAKFYSQALQSFEWDPEVAYLHLITSLEIVSNFKKLNKRHLFDEQTLAILEEVSVGCPDGEKLARKICARLTAVKRLFVRTVTEFIPSEFFHNSESKATYAQLSAESFEASIAAAYDLRSMYVHTGFSFSSWVSASRGNWEVQVGKAETGNRDRDKILDRAPTFVGLERVVRYCLLRFAEANGGYLEG